MSFPLNSAKANANVCAKKVKNEKKSTELAFLLFNSFVYLQCC